MRQPLALGAIAAAAVMSIATSPPPSNAVFSGSANVSGPNFLVSAEQPDWRFRIAVEAELPAEAETEAFDGFLDVNLLGNPAPGVASGLVSCDDGTILDDDTDEYLRLDGFFADCPVEEPCTLVVCLDVSSDGAATAAIEWSAEAYLYTLDVTPDGTPGLDVPVTLTIEEVSSEEAQ